MPVLSPKRGGKGQRALGEFALLRIVVALASFEIDRRRFERALERRGGDVGHACLEVDEALAQPWTARAYVTTASLLRRFDTA